MAVVAQWSNTGSWLVCHEFKFSTAEDLPCRGGMHVKSVEVQTFSHWCGVEVRRRRCQRRCRSRHLTMVQHHEVRRQKSSSS
ncbi:hypothetical protein TNCV_1253331 [Trichonephila clavipes]|nr:hypothetical protein TNCV_1253331 [Trichonephila clavipes]